MANKNNLLIEEYGYILPDSWMYNHFNNDFGNYTFRVKEMVNEEKAREWLQEFSDINKVTWRAARTFPHAGKVNIFKLKLRCRHKTDSRYRKGIKSSKNTDCPAELLVIVRRYIKKSKAKEIDALIKDYPGIVTLKCKHNHLLESAAVLKYRDLDPQVEEKFKEMFMKGHDPASALNSHKIDLMLEHQHMYYQIAADGKYMPSRSEVAKLFEKTFEKEYGSISGEKMFEHLQNYLKEYENTTGGRAQICQSECGEHYFVVLCTPIMLRVHEKIKQSSELVLLDASGGVDKQKHRIYFLVTPTAAGALPLGVIICDCEKESVFCEALQLYKVLLGNNAFFNKKEPEVFITDNDLKEINALNKIFPNSCKLLCQFHMLKSMWSWLCDPKHNIHQNNRQEAYFSFKNLLYSFDEQKMEENLRSFKSFARVNNYEKLANYIDHIYTYKEKWVTCLRHNLPLRGNNTTNYVEVVFRVLKDCILNRVMAFNLSQLVDFVLTRYELYMKQRLIDFSNGRYCNSLLKRMLPDKFNRNEMKEMKIAEISDNSYLVTDKDNEAFSVEIDRGYCSCFMGMTGKLCKHASAVMLSLKENIKTTFNIVCEKTKCDIFYVAEGTLPPNDWFCPLQQLPSQLQSPREDLQLQLQTNQETAPPELELPKEDLPCSSTTNNENRNPTNSDIGNGGEMATVSEECRKQLQDLFNRISNGVKKNPAVFVPAVQKLMKNVTIYARTDSGLLSAMHTFGYSTGYTRSKRSPKNSKNSFRRCKKSEISVQPTSLPRRACQLPGQRSICPGKPRGQINFKIDHKYTAFGMLPSRKRKAPHNLETCVFDNKCLGGRKKAK